MEWSGRMGCRRRMLGSWWGTLARRLPGTSSARPSSWASRAPTLFGSSLVGPASLEVEVVEGESAGYHNYRWWEAGEGEEWSECSVAELLAAMEGHFITEAAITRAWADDRDGISAKVEDMRRRRRRWRGSWRRCRR